MSIGRPRGRNNITKKFTVAFPPDEFLALNDLAEFEGESAAEIVRRAVKVLVRIKHVNRTRPDGPPAATRICP